MKSLRKLLNFSLSLKDINATIITDLKLPEKEIFNKLHKDARWGIKKAIKSGLKVEELNEWDLFYEIYKKNMQEKGLIVRSLDFVKKDSYILFMCKYKNKPIAGCTLTFNDKYLPNIPRLSKSASLKDYRHLQPNNLLYWNCILWAKKKDMKKIDWGGYQLGRIGRKKAHGVNKFKEKWGNLTYYYKKYPFHIAIGRKLIRNFRFFWWLNNKLKRGKKRPLNEKISCEYFSRPGVLDVYNHMETLFKPEEIIIKKFIDSGQRILDVGCGTGRVTYYLHKKGCVVTGIDIVPEMIALAEKKHPDIDFKIMDCGSLSFEDKVFDVVFITYNTLDYIYPIEKRQLALKELKRVLKDKGILIYSSHNSILNGYKLEQRKKGELLTYRANPISHIINLKKLGFKLLKILNMLSPWGYYIFKKK